MKSILMIGGTGTISMSITRLLSAGNDWKVTLLNRGNRTEELPEGVETIIGDIHDTPRMKELLAGRRFDVVANFFAFTTEEVRRDVELFTGKTGQYIFVSTASAYQKPVQHFPITESTPLKNPYWEYSRKKIACEDFLMQAYRENDFPLTIVRPSQTYDNRTVPIPMRTVKSGWQTLCRIRDRKPVIIHGDGNVLWTVTHSDDFAQGFAGLMANPNAIGQAVNIVSDDVLTWNQIFNIMADALDVPLIPFYMTSEAIVKSNPLFEGSLLGEKSHCVIFDTTKLRRLVPWYCPRIRFADVAKGIIQGMMANPKLQIPDPDFDKWCDAVIAEQAR